LILRAPPIFSSKRKRKFFCSAPRSIVRAAGYSFLLGRGGIPPTPPPFRRALASAGNFLAVAMVIVDKIWYYTFDLPFAII